MNTREKGNIGENYAEKYLINKGYKVLARNFECKAGELDIVCRIDDYIVFVEVKYRNDPYKGHPLEAVTEFKQKQIAKAANVYIKKNMLYDNYFRFDVVAIIEEYGNSSIEHVENAFEDPFA